MRRLALLVLILLALVGIPHASAAPVSAPECFPQTGQCLDGKFLDYWRLNGALPVFGYPITGAANEVNRDTGQTYLTQWLERNRLEVHPENAGTPYEILLGLLGKDRLAQLGRGETARESGPQAGCLWFEQTGKNVCNQGNNLGFKRYWESNGLKIPGLDNYARSLQLFGLPLTSPTMETNSSGDTVLTQWFERARFEWHPGNPDNFKVLLGLLGKEVREGAGLPPPPPPPPPPPAGVSVLSHSSYTDTIGAYWIHGEALNNTGSNVQFVKIVTNLYDANNTLVGTDFGYTALDILKPGQRSPFSVLVLDPPANLHHYTLQVEHRTTTEQPLGGLVVVSTGDRDARISGARYIFGEVRNDSGGPARFVKLVATLYNAQGTVVQTDFTYTSLERLESGQASSFEMLVLHWNGAARYEVQVQGRRP